MDPGQVIVFIIGTIVILFGAYYVTYYVGMKASGQTRAGFKNRNIILLDRYAIARDKQFCAVEIAGKVYIVGVTNHAMTLLDTVDAEAYAKLTENNEDNTPWNMTPVGQYGNKLTRKVVSFIAEKTGKKPVEKPVSQPAGEETAETAEVAEVAETASDHQPFSDTFKKAQTSADEETYNIKLSTTDHEDSEED